MEMISLGLKQKAERENFPQASSVWSGLLQINSHRNVCTVYRATGILGCLFKLVWRVDRVFYTTRVDPCEHWIGKGTAKRSVFLKRLTVPSKRGMNQAFKNSFLSNWFKTCLQSYRIKIKSWVLTS